MVDNWLRHIKDIIFSHESELNKLNEQDRVNRLCELNVISQVRNLAHTKAVQYAWDRGQELAIHGWVYSLHDGLLKDLMVTTHNRDPIDDVYHLVESDRGHRPHANEE